jgi:hypothetical protein
MRRLANVPVQFCDLCSSEVVIHYHAVLCCGQVSEYTGSTTTIRSEEAVILLDTSAVLCYAQVSKHITSGLRPG